jgi:RHS repeat-associated protein
MQYRTKNYAENVFDYFYFEKNLQGDVIGVYNASGTLLISYIYDAWGNCKNTYKNGGSSTGAKYNPFRYRGYFYDSDLGFYYLNNRYYDSVTGRFLNTDSYINANGDLLGFNLYAYCSNNPVMYVDPTGYNLDANQKNDDNRDDVVPEAGGIKNAGTGPVATSGVGVAAGSISADTEPEKKDKKALNSSQTKEPHGNSSKSTKPQHGYEIYDKKTGKIMKVGISGRPLKNDISPRANEQVKYHNKQAGFEAYDARILERDMPGRAYALQWEKDTARNYYNLGYEMPFHKKPK